MNTPNENIQIVEHLYTLFAKKDINAILEWKNTKISGILRYLYRR